MGCLAICVEARSEASLVRQSDKLRQSRGSAKRSDIWSWFHTASRLLSHAATSRARQPTALSDSFTGRGNLPAAISV